MSVERLFQHPVEADGDGDEDDVGNSTANHAFHRRRQHPQFRQQGFPRPRPSPLDEKFQREIPWRERRSERRREEGRREGGRGRKELVEASLIDLSADDTATQDRTTGKS